MKKVAFTCLLWVNKPQINNPISHNPWEVIIPGSVYIKDPIDNNLKNDKMSSLDQHPTPNIAYQYPWLLPLGLVLASFGWWESFVSEKAKVSIPWVS